MEVTKILDTTIGDNGPEQTINPVFLKNNAPLRMHIDLASGDTVVIQGRLSQSHNWDPLHTFTDETPADIYPSYLMRAVRTVDGTAGDSALYVQNPFNDVELTEHSA